MKNYYSQKYFEERDLLIPHLAQIIKNLMKKNKLKTVCDVGCGTGRLVQFLNHNGFSAFGCDNSKRALRLARLINKRGTIIYASANKLPYKTESFDLVAAISLIEHLTPRQAEEFLQEANRILRPSGFLFLVTPNFSSPLRIISGKKWFGYKDPTHINFYTPKSLSALLIGSGFKNVKLYFKTRYEPSFNWEFPLFFAKFPKIVKIAAIYFFFSSPFSILRNSLWVFSKKINE